MAGTWCFPVNCCWDLQFPLPQNGQRFVPYQCGNLHRGKDCCARKPACSWLFFWCVDHYRIIFTMLGSTTTRTTTNPKKIFLWQRWNDLTPWKFEEQFKYLHRQRVKGCDLYAGLLLQQGSPTLKCSGIIEYLASHDSQQIIIAAKRQGIQLVWAWKLVIKHSLLRTVFCKDISGCQIRNEEAVLPAS